MGIYEIIGYIGSVLVAVSLTMKNILKLRWINFAGAGIFAIYGGLIGAYPVLALNGFIAVVDLYYLWQMYKQKDYFTLSETKPSDDYLNTFLDYYGDELKTFFPKFEKDNHLNAKYYFILRNMIPAGLFVYEEEAEDTINILLDYAIPDYRDLKNAKFLYFTADFMRKMSYKKLITESHHEIHDKYLRALGFKQIDNKTFLKKVE